MKKSILVAMAGLFSAFYILNPGAGIFELIPDNIPVIGNLDEATAVFILIASLRYFGYDFSTFFDKSLKK